MKAYLNPCPRVAHLVVLTIVLVATCCAPAGRVSPHVPNAVVPDTWSLGSVLVKELVVTSIREMYLPKKEVAFCLVGHIAGDTLIVTDAVPSEPPVKRPATLLGTEVHCPLEVIGFGHTHPAWLIPVECEPSRVDTRLWSTYRAALVSIVVCGSGNAWLGLRDGRFWRARWR